MTFIVTWFGHNYRTLPYTLNLSVKHWNMLCSNMCGSSRTLVSCNLHNCTLSHNCAISLSVNVSLYAWDCLGLPGIARSLTVSHRSEPGLSRYITGVSPIHLVLSHSKWDNSGNWPHFIKSANRLLNQGLQPSWKSGRISPPSSQALAQVNRMGCKA